MLGIFLQSGSSGGSSESVCAKVRVRIVQELVLTRDAFNARLEIENGETSALENIMVEIRITQTYGNGESSKDKFSIGERISLAEFSINYIDIILHFRRTTLSAYCLIKTRFVLLTWTVTWLIIFHTLLRRY